MDLEKLIEAVNKTNPTLADKIRRVADTLSPDDLIAIGSLFQRQGGDISIDEAATQSLKLKVNLKVEKYDGEYSPDKEPFEVIETEDVLIP